MIPESFDYQRASSVSEEYRRAMAKVYLKRALTNLTRTLLTA